MSSSGAMFNKKLDFAKDSVVPSSSYQVFGAMMAFAAYGMTMAEKPVKHAGTSTVSSVDASKFVAIDSKIGAVDTALKAAKAEIADLKSQLVGH
jgi:hypothetical protein